MVTRPAGASARRWFRVHSFTGVFAGLTLFVICWSGTFAVVARDIDWLVTRDARTAPWRAFVGWQAIRDAALAAHPDGAILWIEAPPHGRAAAQVVLDTRRQPSLRVYVDPGSGETLGTWSYLTVQRFFRSFHMEFFGVGGVGQYLVLLFAFPLLLSLGSALAFHRRWWRRFLDAPRPGPAFWSGAHRLAGLWSIWFVVLIGVTSLWYLFEAARQDFGDGRVAFHEADPHHGEARHAAETALAEPPLDFMVAHAEALRPDLAIRSISFHDGRLVFEGQAGHLLVRDRANQLHLDARSGAVLYDQRASDLPLYWRWSDTADPLHFGDFGGLPSRLAWFAFGVILSGSILTGGWLHARRLAREPCGERRHRWPGTVAATVVTLLVLAATIPAGLDEARAYYGPATAGGPSLPSLAPGVRCVILAWSAATCAIIAGWTWTALRPDRARPILARSVRRLGAATAP